MEEQKAEIQALAQRILVKAPHKLGGVAVGEATLGDWLAGKFVPPVEVILKTVSLLVDEPATFWRDSSAGHSGTPIVSFAAVKRFGTD